MSAENQILVCHGRACSEAFQAQSIIDRLTSEDIPKNTLVSACGCLGECKQAPAIKVIKNNQEVTHISQTPISAVKLLKET